MTDVAATRARARLRGQESVARWRLRTGTWAARAYAVVLILPAAAAVLWRGSVVPATAGASAVFAALVLGASFPIARGRRWAAVAVLAFFALDKLAAIAQAGAAGVWNGLVLNLILGFSLAQGVWGAFALAAVERERALVPPLPTAQAV
jgi:hypothetical protein